MACLQYRFVGLSLNNSFFFTPDIREYEDVAFSPDKISSLHAVTIRMPFVKKIDNPVSGSLCILSIKYLY